MTSDGRVIVPTPNHRDRERALRGALARMRGENDVLPLLARECETATAIIYRTDGRDSISTASRRRLSGPRASVQFVRDVRHEACVLGDSWFAGPAGL
jgi:hypothetical protein